MTTRDGGLDESAQYLLRYTAEDWVMLSVVVSEARDTLSAGVSKSEIAATTLALCEILIANGIPPGDLVDGEPGFRPWPGRPTDQIARLRAELDALVARDRLPVGDDVCWFHKVSR